METPRVSIIISNRNDVAMLIVTIRSCIEAFKPLGPNAGEIVVVDNSDKAVYDKLQAALPTGYCRDGTLKIFYQSFPCLYIHTGFPVLFIVFFVRHISYASFKVPY